MSSLETRGSVRSTALFEPFKKSKYFTALYFGQIFSLFGSSITNVILPILVLNISGSTAAMGTVMALYMLPFVIILPFSGVLVDKRNKVHIMLTMDAIRFVLMGALCALIVADKVNMLSLYLFMLLMGAMDSFFQPAYSSVRARVFTEDIRNAANSLTQTSIQALRIFGPIAGGVLISAVSSAWGFGIDAATYLISFLILCSMRSLTFKQASAASGNKFSIKKDFLEGIEVLKQQDWLWLTIIAFSVINIFSGGIIRVLIPWLVNIHYKYDPVVYGTLLSASGAGAIICGIIFGMKKKWEKRGLLAYAGVFISGAAFLAAPFVSHLILLIVCLFVNGAGIMLFGLIWETSLQELVPEEKFGRVASLDMLGSFALLPLGYLITGWIAESAGEILTLLIFSLIIMAVSGILMLHKGIRTFN
ncbi:MFS transporter [Peribacillus kribbensis]|uniref:MFS transporter n=1 Tax=Peribacillus kribbensis TaxID=356658 RepID=UPI0004043E4D|nr:MFS transporter [Peribacillus kribbensis]